jgi:N6-adenosine-specific RNA methylase IME4
MQLLAGQFGAILADPPWPYATYSVKGKGRSVEAHYNTMSIEAIAKLPVAQWALPDCVLFLWITKPNLPRAFEVIRAWGFDYKTNAFVWVKTYPKIGDALFELSHRYFFGLGHWTRSNPEQCLLATRGRPQRLAKDVPELIVAPIRQHSRKPDEIYDRIERLVAGPFLELFASGEAQPRRDWTRWVGEDRPPRRRWKSNSYPGADDAAASA